MATTTDFLWSSAGGAVSILGGVWVRLLNNDTATNYYSTAVTDAVTGSFTHSAPPGDYSLYSGTVATVPGTPNLRSAHYKVPLSSGDDAALRSVTSVTSSPYASATGIVNGEFVSAANPYNVKAYAGVAVVNRLLAAVAAPSTQLEQWVAITPDVAGLASPLPSAVVNGTPATTSYIYLVIAQNAAGDVSTSPTSYVEVNTGPAALGAVNNITVSWPAVTGASQYLVLRTRGGPSQGLIATVVAPTVSYNDQGAAGAPYTYSNTDLNPQTQLPINVTLLDYRYLPTDQESVTQRPFQTNLYQTSAYRLMRRWDKGNDNGSTFAVDNHLTGGTGLPSVSGEAVSIYGGARRYAGSSRGMWAANFLVTTDVAPSAAISTFGVEIDVNNNSGTNATATFICDGLAVLTGGTNNPRYAVFVGQSGGTSWLNGIEITAAYTQYGIHVQYVAGKQAAAFDGKVLFDPQLGTDPGWYYTPFADNTNAGVYGTNAANSLVLWQINNDGSASFKTVATTSVTGAAFAINPARAAGTGAGLTVYGTASGNDASLTGNNDGSLRPSGAFVMLKDLRQTKQSPAHAASPSPDPTLGGIFAPGAMTGNVTVANPTNAAQGQRLLMVWTQDGTGTRTVTYSGTNWRSVGIAAQTTTASTVTIDEAVCIDGTIWRVNRLVTGQTI